MFSILHISDLHRSQEDPVTNASLLSALLTDCGRYRTETPPIPSPGAIIVSGDLVRGAAIGTHNYTDVIQRQYDDAYAFLSQLADRCVAGDRRRVVIVPGNHDVCWNTAHSAMCRVEGQQQLSQLPGLLEDPANGYRWSWHDRHLYKVTCEDRYRERLDAYWTFVERFYRDVNLRLPLDRDRGFNLFELDEGRIIVAALESVHGNDCYADHGGFTLDAIANAGLLIRDMRRHQLSIGVWHHSVHGPPHRSDYMNIDTVYEMIGNGFRLGFHGHQHYSQAVPHHIHLPDRHAMALVGAGSLCAGVRELPRGMNRQYNVVVVADDYSSAAIHVREMTMGNQFTRTHRAPFSVDGSVTLQWDPPVDAVGQPLDRESSRERDVILKAEDAMRDGDPMRAVDLLEGVHRALGSHADRLFVEAARTAERWDLLVTRLRQPDNAEQLVLLVEALAESSRPEDALEALRTFGEQVNLPEHIRGDLAERLQIHIQLRSMP
ncbi:metallophosphoesterase [Candidatus Palauibacter sp.]|uniref:metallophosphoesterase n=1 Tax=Candidatus Palauibacter sp. TaxID=3101350 RepID=UPI003B59BB90